MECSLQLLSFYFSLGRMTFFAGKSAMFEFVSSGTYNYFPVYCDVHYIHVHVCVYFIFLCICTL